MSKNAWAMMLLVLAALAGTGLRGWLVAAKRTLNHDEAISYLCAAGKQGEYRELAEGVQPPFGTWTTAGELKRFFEPEQPLCFARIAHDLVETDIHPPLYFWLLHVWRLAVGLHLWTGPALNMLIALLAMVLLYGLGRYVLRDNLAAAVLCGVWMMSPAVVETCFEARHYDLLGLCTIGFAWALLRCCDRGLTASWRDYAILTLAAAAGMLTHYHFALIIAAAGVLLLLRFAQLDRRRLVAGGAALVAGFVLFATIHPGFYTSIVQARLQAQPFDVADIVPRLQRSLVAYSTFFVSTRYNEWIIGQHFIPLATATAVGLLLGIGFLLAVHRAKSERDSVRGIVYLLITMAVANVGLYVIGVSPRHAMGAQYPALVWPFLALLLLLVTTGLGRLRRVALGLVYCGMLVAGVVGVQRRATRWQSLPDPARFVDAAPAVVVDSVARGILPCVVWHLPGDCPVFAAPDKYLIEHVDAWLPLVKPGGILVLATSYGNTEEQRDRLLALLATRVEPEPIEKGIFGLGRVHILATSRAIAREMR